MKKILFFLTIAITVFWIASCKKDELPSIFSVSLEKENLTIGATKVLFPDFRTLLEFKNIYLAII